MMFRWTTLAALAVAASAAAEEPLRLQTLTVGSKTYTNVTVLGANATDMYFTHANGIGNARLKYLDAELQHHFHYDPKAAAEAEQQQATDDLRYHDSLASNLVAQAEQAALAAKRAAMTSTNSLADPISDRSLLGRPGPALKVGKWLGEKPAIEDRFVLVTFWAPWSIPCRQLIPELNVLQKKFTGKLVVVGVTSEPEQEVLAMTEPKLEFASALDSPTNLLASASVTSIPSVLLLDTKGIVRYLGHPAALTEKKLQALLQKPPEK
jgi:cytochrome c biogenesis protein CcmG, thiol:disulfide interchange protein DsbE